MKLYIIALAVFTCGVAVLAQKQQQYTTPVPILKQINKHNEDGSYSYGYEAADGTFKIESKYPNGEVYGKYGYIDDQGKLREIEYGASRRGFEPAGNDINAAPPTLVNNQEAVRPLAPNEEDDGQYREDPSVYYKDEAANQQPAYTPTYQSRYTQPQAQVAAAVVTPQPFTFQTNSVIKPIASFQQTQPQTFQPAPVQQPQQTYQPVQQQTYQPVQQQTYQPVQQASYQPQSFQSFQPQQQTYQPAPVQQQTYQPQPSYQPVQQQTYQPAFRPQTSFSGFQSQPSFSSQFNGHPATNVDINSGSYTVQYK